MTREENTAPATATAHTPGPWTAQRCSIRAADGKVVAICNGWVNGAGNDATPFANARLIAAAPELLEACERMKAAIDDMLADEELQVTSDVGDLLIQVATMPSLTIAKARGKA